MSHFYVFMRSAESYCDIAAHIVGAGLVPAADAAAGMPQDQVFQLLSAAVYSANEDPQRQHSLQQLSRITPRLQEPPGPGNDVAVFSNRCTMTQPVQYIMCGIYNPTCFTATYLCLADT